MKSKIFLEDLLHNVDSIQIDGDKNIAITSISTDSRTISENSCFIAIKGYSTDGHKYIETALKKGAKLIIYEDDYHTDIPHTSVKLQDTRKALGILANNFYDNPSSKLKLVGITGTNGKTTTVSLLYQLFTRLGYHCGLLSTIANYVGNKEIATNNTTSDPITMAALMNDMVQSGCEYCFMEVSSIGIEQGRIKGLDFDIAIFSNISHDHLDYHKTFAEYIRCKKLFFDNLNKKSQIALTNIDDKNGLVMVQNTKAKVLSYACKTKADFNCQITETSFEGMNLRIDNQEIWTRLIGEHNAYNLLAIYACAICLGQDKEESLIALSALGSVKGRLESISAPNGIKVILDYAHTPDALDNVLKTLRAINKSNELICLFGCGGDRDKSKRPEMAAVAEKYADKIIISSDNSRTEKTEDIMADIKAGLSRAGLAKSLMIADRAEAIKTAMLCAKEDAVILIAGKGHEDYQIIGTEKKHFDEREIVADIIKLLEN